MTFACALNVGLQRRVLIATLLPHRGKPLLKLSRLFDTLSAGAHK